jgi:predicted Zn-dependent peptidase
MKRFSIFFVTLFVSVGFAGTQEEIPRITLQDFSRHLMHYFENKNDLIVYEAISIYENNNYGKMLDQIDNILLFFFYGIKVDNISRYNNFMSIIKKRELQRLINIFDTIENNDIGLFLEQQEPNPDLNDIYWTLFFSSGNVQYINYLITIINNYNNETENINYYLAARSAIWSMALNILTYSQVREYFVNSNINNILKEYVLNTNPNIIQSETIEFIRQQKEKGIW